MNIRVVYLGMLFALFAPLGAMSEPCGRFAIDTLKEDLLAIKQLVGLAIATPALDAVVVGAVEPGSEEIQAALQDAEACLSQAAYSIAQEELAQYAEKLEAYWLQLLDVTRSRKNKNFCRLFAQVACINRLKARTVEVTGTLTVQRLEVSELVIDDVVFDGLLVNGDATITGNLAVGGNETLAGDLSVGGSETIANNLAVGGDGAVAGDFAVGDDLAVTDDGAFGGDVTIGGNLDIPSTTSATVGVITKNTLPFLHNFNANIFLGISTGNFTTTGTLNIGIGFLTMPGLSTGERNTIIGFLAGANITSGSSNTAVGEESLDIINTQSNNTAVGQFALKNTAGSNNTAVGQAAGNAIGTIDNATLIGQGASTVNASTNTTSLGFNAACIASNQVTLGDANVTTLRCATTTITAISDIREKKDIAPITLGLSFIRTLKPVKFRRLCQDDSEPRTYGLIAQDVIAALTDAGVDIADFAGISHNSITDRYELRFGEFQMIALKAVQELALENEQLRQEIADIKAVLSTLVVDAQ